MVQGRNVIGDENWYLLRTKAGEERRARDQVGRFAADVLLPLIRVRIRRWGRLAESVAPLFPCYLFALLDLEHESATLRCTPGIREVVVVGGEAAIVPQPIIDELKLRCSRGPIELPQRAFAPKQRVQVMDGPFRDFEAVFERTLSGAERVAILLRIMGRETRVVLPAKLLAPLEG